MFLTKSPRFNASLLVIAFAVLASVCYDLAIAAPQQVINERIVETVENRGGVEQIKERIDETVRGPDGRIERIDKQIVETIDNRRGGVEQINERITENIRGRDGREESIRETIVETVQRG